MELRLHMIRRRHDCLLETVESGVPLSGVTQQQPQGIERRRVVWVHLDTPAQFHLRYRCARHGRISGHAPLQGSQIMAFAVPVVRPFNASIDVFCQHQPIGYQGLRGGTDR